MNLQGDFEGLTLASIFQMLCSDQKTGVLTVTCDREESRVFFEQGTIVYASASLKESRLGFLMRTDGVISPQQLQKCLAQAKEEKTHMGKLLVDKGYISLDTIKKYNTKQVEVILYNLLFWEKGQFEYEDADLDLKGMIITQLNPMKLILEASRRIDELSILKKSIPSDRIIFTMSGKVQRNEEINLNANEWRVLSLIDGSRTVRHIIDDSGYDEYAVYKIIFSVISSGLIQAKEVVQQDEEIEKIDYLAILNVFNDILAVIKKSIEDELGDMSHSLFEEVKSDLPNEFKAILDGYHPDNTNNLDPQFLRNVRNKLDTVKDPQGFLIMGFTKYCVQILKRVGGILGSQPLSGILTDIEKVLGYIKKYQAGSIEKSKIVSEMKSVIARLKVEFQINKKGGIKSGLFSFFSS